MRKRIRSSRTQHPTASHSTRAPVELCRSGLCHEAPQAPACPILAAQSALRIHGFCVHWLNQPRLFCACVLSPPQGYSEVAGLRLECSVWSWHAWCLLLDSSLVLCTSFTKHEINTLVLCFLVGYSHGSQLPH